MIWYKKYELNQVQKMQVNTLSEHLGIEYTHIGENSISAKMPVDKRTRQPFGICHGGAYMVLGEELGSMASYLCVNPEHFIGVGIEINANHVKAVKEGFVTGVCAPIHMKGRNHVWDIKIYDETQELCSVCRFTCQIVPRKRIEEKP